MNFSRHFNSLRETFKHFLLSHIAKHMSLLFVSSKNSKSEFVTSLNASIIRINAYLWINKRYNVTEHKDPDTNKPLKKKKSDFYAINEFCFNPIQFNYLII